MPISRLDAGKNSNPDSRDRNCAHKVCVRGIGRYDMMPMEKIGAAHEREETREPIRQVHRRMESK